MRQDDGHHPVILQVVQAVQQEGEVGGALRRHTVVFETRVVARLLLRVPAETEGRIGHHGIEGRLLCRIGLAQPVPVVFQRVAVMDLELGVLHPVQQHVHARQVVGGDVGFLPHDAADLPARLLHALAHVEQQRTGAAGEIEHAAQRPARAG